MSKPEWKDAPAWAKWLALDAGGDWGWYESKPLINEESESWVWTLPLSSEWELAGFSGNHGTDWRETLESRP